MLIKKRFKSGLSLDNNVRLTKKQEEFHKIMSDGRSKITFLSGPAGSSKTFLAFYTALDLLNKGKFEKILYLRTPIESASRSLGALKGELKDKTQVYTQICDEKLHEMLHPDEVKILFEDRFVEGDVINFIRGKSISNTIIIFDEVQNANTSEIRTVLTRINKNSKAFLCGDSIQSDLKSNQYDYICSLFDDEDSKQNGINSLKFTNEDIMRDPVVGFVLDKMEGL